MRKNEFEIVYYLDDERQKILDVESLKKTIENFSIKYGAFYAFIIHDKDLKDNVLKKKHLHILFKLPKGKSIDFMTVANFFGTDIQFINKINYTFVHSIQYLTHKNDVDKYQYNFDDIFTNDKVLLINYFKCELPRVFDVGGVLEKQALNFDLNFYVMLVLTEKCKNYKDLLNVAIKNNQISLIAKYSYFFISLFKNV